MGLFTKKDPCAICGGKVKGLLPWRIENHYICNDCYGNVDLPGNLANQMTLNEFCAYRAFRAENQKLKETFQTTQKISFGFLGEKIVFDHEHKLFCADEYLDKTIFEGSQIRSFIIREDSSLLFEGNASGLTRHNSNIRSEVMSMNALLLTQKLRRFTDNDSQNTVDIPDPFEQFHIEIELEHPYWQILCIDINAPHFNSTDPSVTDYLDAYQEKAEALEQLAEALMTIAFADASVKTAERAAAPVDAVEEIKRFKSLLDQGIITEEEFAAKKQQLLGI